MLKMCGYASEYNLPPGQEPYGIKVSLTHIPSTSLSSFFPGGPQNARYILAKSISMNGFLVFNLIAEHGWKPWTDEYLPLVRDGKVTQREHKTSGLENLAKGFVEVLKGDNQGKAIIVVADS